MRISGHSEHTPQRDSPSWTWSWTPYAVARCSREDEPHLRQSPTAPVVEKGQSSSSGGRTPDDRSIHSAPARELAGRGRAPGRTRRDATTDATTPTLAQSSKPNCGAPGGPLQHVVDSLLAHLAPGLRATRDCVANVLGWVTTDTDAMKRAAVDAADAGAGAGAGKSARLRLPRFYDRLERVPYPTVILQDAVDADNSLQLVAYLAKVHGPPSRENPVLFVLQGRPALLGIPHYYHHERHPTLNVNDALQKARWKETLFSKEGKRFLLDTFMNHIVVSANNPWECGADYVLPDGTDAWEAVREDSALIQRSNALKFLLLFKQILQLPSLEETMQVVHVFDGGIASTHGEWSQDDDTRRLVSPLGHRIHVADYLQYDCETGLVASEQYYASHYMQPVIDHPPSANAYDLVPGTTDAYLYNPAADSALGARRQSVRADISRNIAALAEGARVDSLLRPMASLAQYLHRPETPRFDVMALAPYTSFARLLAREGVADKLGAVVAQACTYFTSANLFYDQFNIMGDPSASRHVLHRLAELNVPLYVLPSQVSKHDKRSYPQTTSEDVVMATAHPELVAKDGNLVAPTRRHVISQQVFQSWLCRDESALGASLRESMPSAANPLVALYRTWNDSKSGGSRKEVQFDVFANWLLVSEVETRNSGAYFTMIEAQLVEPKDNCAWILDTSVSLRAVVAGASEAGSRASDPVERFFAAKELAEIERRLRDESKVGGLSMRVFVASESSPLVYPTKKDGEAEETDDSSLPVVIQELMHIVQGAGET